MGTPRSTNCPREREDSRRLIQPPDCVEWLTHNGYSARNPGFNWPKMQMNQTHQTVSVSLGERSYDIDIASDGIEQLPADLDNWLSRRPYWQSERKSTLLVTDANVTAHATSVQKSLKAAGWTVTVLTVPAGEASKSLDQISQIYDTLVEMPADRRTPVIAVGGGVIGDLAGFAAASYTRGMPFVQVPTTLLADVDSSVGGKVGINHPKGKNLIGAFHQPLGVFIETSFLNTLPDRDYFSGMAEVVKYGVIMDEEFFEFLEANTQSLVDRDPNVLRDVIAKCCRLKADVVEKDEYERSGLRAILNYGHTFAHGYEALCGYGELLHGEAVSIGMIDASRLAEKLGRISDDVIERQVALLSALNLPTEINPQAKPATADMISCMKLDKKTVGGKLKFVLPDRIGHVELISGVDETIVAGIMEKLPSGS